jgi:hypothetical protein
MDYIDGFLEGHEGPGTKVAYRFFIVSYVIMSIFAAFANIGTVTKAGHRNYDVVNSIAIIGLTALSLVNVKWYRQDNMDPKHKKLTALMIVLVLLMDVAGCIAFHDTMEYVPPPPPTMAPLTFPPTPSNSPTPSPNGTTSPPELRYRPRVRIN